MEQQRRTGTPLAIFVRDTSGEFTQRFAVPTSGVVDVRDAECVVKVAHIRRSGDSAGVAARWADALKAEELDIATLRTRVDEAERCGVTIDFQLIIADAHSISPGDVRDCRQMLDRSPGCKLVLHVDHRPPEDPGALARYEDVLRRADLVLTAHHEIRIELQSKLGIFAQQVTAPFVIEPRAVVRTGRSTLAVIAARGYGRWQLMRTLGILTYVFTLFRHRVVVLSPDAPAHELVRLLEQSEIACLPEPIEDAGALAAHCAAVGAILVANRRYDPAKVTFSYTVFDPSHRFRCAALLFWLDTSAEFAEFFRENALRSLVHLSGENRRADLIRKLQYRFPEASFEPRSQRSTALLDQIRHLSGPPRIDYGEDECIVVCLVHNGQEHLPSFLKHHRTLGICHFVFVDNGSNDETLAILGRQPDVTVYQCDLPHKYFENEMRRLVIEEHCRHRFCLNVDIDELFDYPCSDRLSLRDLMGYMREIGATAMAAYMLDMYARENSFDTTGVLDLKSEYPYYDLSDIDKYDYYRGQAQAFCDYNVLLADHVKCYFGGIRKRIFKSKVGGHYLLMKHPLIYLDGKLEPVTNPHYCNHAVVADVTGVILHYKFTPSFRDKVAESLASRRYVKFAHRQYDGYQKKLEGGRSLRIDTPSTRRLEHVDQLVDEGFIAVSPAFQHYVRRVNGQAE